MEKYSIAGLRVLMNVQGKTARHAGKYKTDEIFETADITVSADDVAITEYSQRNKCSLENAAYMIEAGIFYRQLLNFNGIFLHASAVVVDDKAYLFSAPCGTGKSTHTSLWLELFGKRAYILNDDKPAIRVLDDGIYAYGTPFSGKNDMSAPKKVKLQGICFISRGKEDVIEPMDKKEAVFKMYHASLRKIDAEQVTKEFEILEKIALNVPVFHLTCTPTLNAAKVAYKKMSKVNLK